MENKCEGTPSSDASKWYIVLVHLPYGEDVIALTLFPLSNFQEYNSFLLKALGITGADKRIGGGGERAQTTGNKREACRTDDGKEKYKRELPVCFPVFILLKRYF